MRTWDGKSKGSPLGYRIFFFLIRNTGLGPAYLLLIFVALFYTLFSFRATGASYKYFRIIQGNSVLSTWMKIYKSYYVFGQTLIDKFAILAGKGEWFSFTSEGHEVLERLNSSTSPALLISAHLGNWEVAGHLLKGYDMPVNVVMHDAEHENIKRLMGSLNAIEKYRIIALKEDRSHLLELHGAVKRGELICMHGDRFMSKDQAVSRPFFGKEASFPKGPFSFGARLKLPVVFVFALREPGRNYRFMAIEPDANSSWEGILENYIQVLEKIVERYPEQWFNYYEFWNSYR